MNKFEFVYRYKCMSSFFSLPPPPPSSSFSSLIALLTLTTHHGHIQVSPLLFFFSAPFFQSLCLVKSTLFPPPSFSSLCPSLHLCHPLPLYPFLPFTRFFHLPVSSTYPSLPLCLLCIFVPGSSLLLPSNWSLVMS